MIENIHVFADDWRDPAEIEIHWRELREFVSKCT
jgi:hypothetical protein